MTKYRLVKIDGVDCTADSLRYRHQWNYGEGEISKITNAIFRETVETTITNLKAGMTFQVYESYSNDPPLAGDIVFSGYIVKIEKHVSGMVITAYDKLWDLIRKEINHEYDEDVDASAGVMSEIFKDIVETFGGLTAEVQSSGAVNTLAKFRCNRTDPYERCKALSRALNWCFYYRADTDKVYFEPKGFNSNLNTIYIGGTSHNIIGKPKWRTNMSQMVNSLTIIGARQIVKTSKLFTGDAATTTFTLDHQPVDIHVYYGAAVNFNVTAPSEQYEKTGGLESSSTSPDYTVDAIKKTFETVTFTPAASANNLIATYSYSVPTPVVDLRQDSIDKYGLFERTITLGDVTNVVDAEERLNNILDARSTPHLSTDFRIRPNIVSTWALKPGQIIPVIDVLTLNEGLDIDSSFIVKKVISSYPEKYVEVSIGDRDALPQDYEEDMLIRIKRLEEEQTRDQDILLTLRQQSVDVTTEPRYFQAEQNTIGNALIFGSNTNGLLGVNNGFGGGQLVQGSAALGSVSTVRMIQYQDTYTEDFIDNDFKDAGNTTADWDTGNEWIDFTAAEVGQSLVVHNNNVTVTTAKLTITSSSGTFLIKMSADNGSNWETVTSGTAHTFTNTGTQLMWQITENAAGTGRIETIVIEDYV